MRLHRIVLPLLLFVLPSLASGQGRDLREQYGTSSLDAARQLSSAIKLSQAKKHKEARAAVEAAVKADPRCQLAFFWKGIILANLGDIDESIVAYKKAFSDDVIRTRHIASGAANNLALIYIQQENYQAANIWFTRAILEDFDNNSKQRGRAYRNMAISLSRQGKHFSAAVAMGLAYKDKFPDVTQPMLRKFFDRVQDEDYAALLHFDDKLPRLEKRTQETKLSEIALANAPTEAVAEVLSDPRGRHVVAVPPNGENWYVVSGGDKPSVARVAGPGKHAGVCLADGHLYFLLDGPARIVKLDVSSGKTVGRVNLRGAPSGASGLVVLPAHGLAYFCADEDVQAVRMSDGMVSRTDIPGQVIAAHPNQRILYSYLKPKREAGGGVVVINGRRYFIRRKFDWLQTTVFQSVVTSNGPLLAAMRENVSSNANQMSVSPDGKWLAVAGRGGYRPRAGEGGYGVGVLHGVHLDHTLGFFKTEPFPLGVCFNPVTGQMAVVREADARVFHLSAPSASVEVKGKFSGASTWSGDGRYLVLANAGGGITVRENTLTAAETARAGSWWKNVKVPPLISQGAVGGDRYEPVESLRTFELKVPSRKELAAALEQAASKGRVDRPGRSLVYPLYVKDPEHRKAALGILGRLREKQDGGIIVFNARKALKTHPDSVLLRYFLGVALKRTDQGEEAEKEFLAALRADAGRTELSPQSLNELAELLAARKEDLIALHCLAASLYLDRANPRTLSLAHPLLAKHKFGELVKRFPRLAEDGSAPAAEPLPALPRPGAPGAKKTSAELYKMAVPSVVQVQAGKAGGSGVCIARADLVLTNHHVIAGAEGDVFVHPYTWKDKELVRLDKVKARVIYRSAAQDIAVLKLEKAVPTLTPLPVVLGSPAAGEKVYAIGSPGLGKEVLEQTISEGLVSSAKRKLDGALYLQHSAAVNPGNSGGPLLNEHGQVVGMVTFKVKLEGVSFAVRVEEIRKVFKSP
jgi:S1-C subfamily serine protease/Tfp pilus assembly protein PilF